MIKKISAAAIIMSAAYVILGISCNCLAEDKDAAFIMRGVTWSPATYAPDSGPNPHNPSETVPYGFFFDWYNRDPQGHVVFTNWMRGEHKKHYKDDIALMKKMNINTVRLYGDLGDKKKDYRDILDEFEKSGISVIMTVSSSKDDLDAKRYIKVIKLCKDHPAILFWNLGNEWNLDYSKFFGYDTVASAARAVEKAASEIKKLDPGRMVASCLGDRFADQDPENTVKSIVETCGSVDIWGLNIYRGRTFGDLFEQWRAITDKPMYISEFGIDSFETTGYTKAGSIHAVECRGAINEGAQAELDLTLWKEIEGHLKAVDPGEQCLGGTVHTFNDTPWKVGNYHVLLGGILDYSDPVQGVSYKAYNTEGIYLIGSAPDDVFNEEYFGLVDAERKPKEAYRRLNEYYNYLEDTYK